MGKKKHIVIVEDNQDLAAAIQETLSDKGYTVSVANNGEVGIELIKSEKPSLLLLDSLLPGMSGIELLEELAQYRKENELSVIMLSNVDDPEELKNAREHDIREYLIKTQWRMEDIVAKISKYL